MELNHKKGKPYYYLVKDVKVRGRRTKTRVYIGHNEPSAEDVEHYRKQHAYTIEAKAAAKRAELSASFYSSKNLTQDQIVVLETIRYLYKTFTGLLTTSEIEVYERDFEVNYVQGTTSIEGNTLTTQQAYDLLVNNIPPDGKSLREINEVQNFKNVKKYRDSFRGKVTLVFIKTLHSLIMNNIDNQSAGVFRRIDIVCIAGCDLPVTPAILIKEELSNLIDSYYEQLEAGVHPFEASVMFHYNFEIVHPFTDGNGRVGREIFNCMLKKCGYPRLLFLGDERSKYLRSLKFGNDENNSNMIGIFADLISEQRFQILTEKLREVVIVPKDVRQVRLDEFYSLKSARNKNSDKKSRG